MCPDAHSRDGTPSTVIHLLPAVTEDMCQAGKVPSQPLRAAEGRLSQPLLALGLANERGKLPRRAGQSQCTGSLAPGPPRLSGSGKAEGERDSSAPLRPASRSGPPAAGLRPLLSPGACLQPAAVFNATRLSGAQGHCLAPVLGLQGCGAGTHITEGRARRTHIRRLWLPSKQPRPAASTTETYLLSALEAGVGDHGVGGLASPEASLPGRRPPVSSQGPPSVPVCVLISSSKDTGPLGLGPTRTSF